MSRQPIKEEEFEKRIKDRFPQEEFVLLEYSGTGQPCKIQCNNCQFIYEIKRAINFLAPTKAHGCVHCYGLWKEREQRINVIKKI